MKKITVIALLLAAALGAQARNGSGKPAYKDASRPVEERVSDLLSRMTLEEKVMQLNQYTLGRNDNANNVADPVDKIPAEIGSLIYFDTSPEPATSPINTMRFETSMFLSVFIYTVSLILTSSPRF